MFDKSIFTNHLNNASNANRMDAGMKTPFSINEQLFGAVFGGRKRGPEPERGDEGFRSLMNTINSHMNHPPYRKGFTSHMKENPNAHPSEAHEAGVKSLRNHLYTTQSERGVPDSQYMD